MALAGVGQHFSRNFDQYTIMCVFGSVVGCVVLPLMAQSLESLIITAILFGVTVKTLNKNGGGGGGGGGTRDPQAEDRKKEKKNKKPVYKRHVQPLQNVMDGDIVRQQRELDLMRREELKELEKEHRSEERHKKKAKKREERLQRREEEKIEKEKQEAVLQQLKKERAARKKSKQSSSTSDLPSAVIDPKPLRRERQYSTSSSASSVSTYSSPAPVSTPCTAQKRRPPPRQPKRASSAPLMTATPPQISAGQYAPQLLVSNSACSTPSSHRNHAPLQMFHVLPILPFISPQTPHPHFQYGPTQMESHQSYQHSSSNWSGQVTDADSANVSYQPPWINRTTGHMTADLVHSPQEHGNRSSNSREVDLPSIMGCGPAQVDPPSLMGTCGPAQGFYSFLNDQALTTDLPATSSSNIWTPPSSSVSQEAKGEWPDWSTLND